ncbi:DUF502 domain-containing protein [Tropicimonas isoalkanivorans]|uniref:Uncharacterized membrane protein n=1 Tax=Tropicimonas isoalkanivorans TaxID=441112 RepID=A0A1I1DET1_9RHOB|nr:DUF502 domain-containing protein [Tropicimonas isoalkanivorans]SFB71043.1 Uncharacterized membrane protein [Tropicimonas isoalkanivorans]
MPQSPYPDHGRDLPPAHPRRKPGLLANLRSSFLTGLVVIAPVGLTVWLIWTVVGWVDSFVLPFVPDPYKPETIIRDFFGEDTTINVRGVGVVFFLIFSVVVGWIAKGVIGRSLIDLAEGIVERMPIVRTIYGGVKQIAETVFAQTETNFDKACLIEYPRPGLWAIAFVSTSAKGEIHRRVPRDERIMSVFLPTTPNPTSGYLLFVPEADLIYLDMSIEDAAKLVISAGLVYPADRTATTPPRPDGIPLAVEAERQKDRLGA